MAVDRVGTDRTPPRAGRGRRSGAPDAVAGKSSAEKISQQEDEEEQDLVEDIDPDDDAPIYEIVPLHPTAVRGWLALGSLILLALMYLGMFLLIEGDATEQDLLVWGGLTASVNTLAGAAGTYYFTKREAPTRRRRRR